MTPDQIAAELAKPADTNRARFILDLLEKAHALIKDPAHWTQAAAARDADGKPCPPDSPDAVCFCSVGAICRVTYEPVVKSTLLAVVRGQIDPEDSMKYSLTVFNDHSDHAEVMQAWERAIEQQQKGIQS